MRFSSERAKNVTGEKMLLVNLVKYLIEVKVW